MQIRIHRRASRFIRALPADLQLRLTDAVHSLRDDPFPSHAVKVRGSARALFRIRVGSYRALYTVDQNKQVIYVLIIDKRSRVYGRL